jgi:hypothetical protein
MTLFRNHGPRQHREPDLFVLFVPFVVNLRIAALAEQAAPIRRNSRNPMIFKLTAKSKKSHEVMRR